MNWKFDDGGRSAAGFKGEARDCVTRSIAIITGMEYREVYDWLHEYAQVVPGRSRVAMAARRYPSPSRGCHKPVYEALLDNLGYVWAPTMFIGSGCQVHLRSEELPDGRLLVRVSRHITAVIDGVIYDTHDCARGGTRCVYGYYQKES